MGHNRGATGGVPHLDVASALRDKNEIVGLRIRMMSAEASRLGMDEFPPDLGFANESEVARRRVLEV